MSSTASGAAAGTAVMPGWGTAIGAVAGAAVDIFGATQDSGGTSVKSRKISQAGYDKIVYDILSSDQGLAALAGGESGAGLFGSSTKGLMAQDLTAKLAGELALLQSEETTEQKNEKGSVICTALYELGKLNRWTYLEGIPHFRKLNPYVIYGYQWWGIPVAQHIYKYPEGKVTKLFTYLVNKRYNHVLGYGSLLGAASVFIGHPLMNLLGRIRLTFSIDKEPTNVSLT